MFRRLQKRANGLIKLVDVAPEEPGNLDFIRECHNEAVSYTHLDVYKRQGVACGAAGGNVQPFLIRKPKGGKCRLPQGGPDPLGVKHQAVHIKNNAVDHAAVSYTHLGV